MMKDVKHTSHPVPAALLALHATLIAAVVLQLVMMRYPTFG